MVCKVLHCNKHLHAMMACVQMLNNQFLSDVV